MKAIIPVAGLGTRLRPHTYTLPKALLSVAGKPILGHIIDEVINVGGKEIILVVGYMGDKIREYVKGAYPKVTFHFAHQEKKQGLGHAISLAEKFVKGEPVLIIYGDTIFVGDISKGIKNDRDGYLGVKTVDDPRRFGTVEMDGGKIVKLVEKPSYIKKMPVIVGVNYIKNSDLMFKCLHELFEKDIRTKGEYQITDAFQLMVDHGANIGTFPMEGWYDCGKPEALLETNQYLLNNGHDNSSKAKTENSVIIPPVFIGHGAVVKNSIIGPYVSIAPDSQVETSIIKNSILNRNASVSNAQLEHSLIGENAVVHDIMDKLNVGDNSEISFLKEG